MLQPNRGNIISYVTLITYYYYHQLHVLCVNLFSDSPHVFPFLFLFDPSAVLKFKISNVILAHKSLILLAHLKKFK